MTSLVHYNDHRRDTSVPSKQKVPHLWLLQVASPKGLDGVTPGQIVKPSGAKTVDLTCEVRNTEKNVNVGTVKCSKAKELRRNQTSFVGGSN